MSRFNGVEEFVAVAEAGSFAGAAKALGVSNAHISRSIARLETKVDARLFDRTTRSISLTSAGEAFIKPLRRIVESREEAFAMMSQDNAPKGELRITCSAALGHSMIIPHIRSYAQSYPDLSVYIQLTNRRVDLISERFDIAIRTGHLPDSRLIATKISARSWVTCASKKYLERHGTPTDISQLDKHDLLEGTRSTWNFKSRKTEQGEKNLSYKVNSKWRCNSGEGVLEAANAHMGICQLPAHYLKDHLDSGRLEQVLQDYTVEDEPIWAVYPSRKHLMPKVKNLIETLKSEMK